MYRFLADATMVLHFAFLVYVVLGGFVAWKWPRTIIAHVAAATWGALIIVFEWICPLTPVEDYFREQAGQAGLAETGFIDTYLTGVIYPEEHLELVRAAAAGIVLISWAGFGVLRARAKKPARAR